VKIGITIEDHRDRIIRNPPGGTAIGSRQTSSRSRPPSVRYFCIVEQKKASLPLRMGDPERTSNRAANWERARAAPPAFWCRWTILSCQTSLWRQGLMTSRGSGERRFTLRRTRTVHQDSCTAGSNRFPDHPGEGVRAVTLSRIQSTFEL
jgi:hypothetical protein